MKIGKKVIDQIVQKPLGLYTDDVKISSWVRGLSPYFSNEDNNEEFILHKFNMDHAHYNSSYLKLEVTIPKFTIAAN